MNTHKLIISWKFYVVIEYTEHFQDHNANNALWSEFWSFNHLNNLSSHWSIRPQEAESHRLETGIHRQDFILASRFGLLIG